MYQRKMYKLVWEEQFDKSEMLNKDEWEYYQGCPHPDAELEYYQIENKKNTFIRNNKLVLRANKERVDNYEYTSAKIRTKRAWKYGKFEIRAKLPLGKGTWPAIWLMPKGYKEDEWPGCGEIDMMEHLAQNLGEIHVSLHTLENNWIKRNDHTEIYDLDKLIFGYNKYTMIWTEKSIKFFINDELCYEEKKVVNSTVSWPFDKEFFLIINLAVGGWGGLEGIDDNWPQEFIIDYIKVYQ